MYLVTDQAKDIKSKYEEKFAANNEKDGNRRRAPTMSFNKKAIMKEITRRTSYKPDDSQRLHILDFLRLLFLRNPAGLNIWNNLYAPLIKNQTAGVS